MKIRPIDWYDLPAFLKGQNHTLSLDSTLELTRGNPAGALALLHLLQPSRGSYTAVVECEENGKLIGQVTHLSGQRSAAMAFLLPRDGAPQDCRVGLLDALARECTQMGALSVTAESVEQSDLVDDLRKACFVVYCWQRIWKLPVILNGSLKTRNLWQEAREVDEFDIRSLFHAVAPPLVQSAESAPPCHHGLVYRPDDLKAYVEAISGPRGVCLLPLLHPDVQETDELLRDLAHVMSAISRPTYVVVRSYQSWLEGALEQLGAEPSQRQVVMVRHLVQMQKMEEPVLNRVAESQTFKPTANIRNSTLRKP